MNETGVREIQLTAKQLVFVFMAAIVFSVAVFLLGVAVGRGGASDAPAVAGLDAAVTTTEIPPATKADPADLKYHDTLQTPPAGTKAQTPAPPAASPPASASPDAPPTIAADSPVAGKSSPPPATTANTPPPAAATPPAAAVTPPPAPPATAPARPWFVQVASFRERQLADKLVQDLKRQNHAAQLVVIAGNLPNKVRVGPFAAEGDARAAAKRLAKYKPVVIRP
jgi:cell division septation protein DedD